MGGTGSTTKGRGKAGRKKASKTKRPKSQRVGGMPRQKGTQARIRFFDNDGRWRMGTATLTGKTVTDRRGLSGRTIKMHEAIMKNGERRWIYSNQISRRLP